MTIEETIINIHTNTDTLSKVEMIKEANRSKTNARVKLLQQIHQSLKEEESMDTAYGYNPQNDMSFTGEFEAIGV